MNENQQREVAAAEAATLLLYSSSSFLYASIASAALSFQGFLSSSLNSYTTPTAEKGWV